MSRASKQVDQLATELAKDFQQTPSETFDVLRSAVAKEAARRETSDPETVLRRRIAGMTANEFDAETRKMMRGDE